MKRPLKLVFAGVLVLSFLSSLPEARGQATDWKKIPIPPLHEFHPQEPRRVALPNGMVIFLQEDHELPLIRAFANVRGGSREEPADKIGLVSVYGDVWRTGGTKSKTGDELDDYLEARAARVETWGDLDSTGVSLDCLKQNFDEVFKVYVELMREPAFREDKIPLAKQQLETEIARRNDNAGEIAGREARKLAYGADSVYARVPEYSTVAAVTREDLIKWHDARIHPNNIILGVIGDFDSEDMEAKLREAFASWPEGPAAPKFQTTISRPKPGIYFVEKDDVNQSAIRMVDLGTTRDSPDYFAIEVFNEVFGGGFSSRLFSDIRSKKGLAYAVGGGIGTDYDHPGVLMLSMGTKSSTTAASIDALYEEMDGLKTNPPTAGELKKAKDSILNSFIFRFDSRAKVLSERILYEFFGYPADFLEKYRAGIEKVAREDVVRVIERYIHKNQMAVLVVGKPADFDRPLSSFGQVTALDITIPSGKTAADAGQAVSNPEGKALLSKVIEGLGGQEKVRAVKAFRQKVTILASTPQGEMSLDADQVIIFPDRLWQKMTGPMGEMTMVFSPAAAFMQAPMGVRDMPASQKADVLNELKHDPFYVAQHSEDPKFVFAAGGNEKIGDIEAQILDVSADGARSRWWIDPQNGRILRAQSLSGGAGSGPDTVVDYSEWKSFEGLTMPSKETRTRGGETEATVEVKEVQINPTVDPHLFDRPAEGQNP